VELQENEIVLSSRVESIERRQLSSVLWELIEIHAARPE